MHNLDDKHLTRPGFEPSTSEFQAISEPMNHRGRPLLNCQQLASPREGVLINNKIDRDTPLYIPLYPCRDPREDLLRRNPTDALPVPACNPLHFPDSGRIP